MKELLIDIDRWRARGEKVALATVVATRRSSPRPVGSKLAVSENGELAGSVSGGCVESDVVLAAQDVLAGGEQQMVAMGRALMSKPKLLLMDEPSMGLAPILVERSFEIIQQVHESGVAMLVVEQNANVSLSIADRGYVLSTGRLVLEGKAEDLREEAGYTILVIEHDMHVVEGISDRVVALDHGVQISEGTFDQVATDPRVVEAYLGTTATTK